MPPHTPQTFILPDQFAQKTSTIRADAYNLAHTLLKRTDSHYVFVPIRSMLYLAIIEAHDIWFVDSQAYAVKDNEGGRLITVSWHDDPAIARSALNENMALRVVYYQQDRSDIQGRLNQEFYQAMLLMDQRYRDQQIPGEGARILNLTCD
jgi:hypothetical protein